MTSELDPEALPDLDPMPPAPPATPFRDEYSDPMPASPPPANHPPIRITPPGISLQDSDATCVKCGSRAIYVDTRGTPTAFCAGCGKTKRPPTGR